LLTDFHHQSDQPQGREMPPQHDPPPQKFNFKTSESHIPMLEEVQGKSTMYNTFQQGIHHATESRIIMGRKMHLEQVHGGAYDSFMAATTAPAEDYTEDDDRKAAASLLQGTSPTPSMEDFFELGHPYGNAAFAYRAEESVPPSTFAPPGATSYFYGPGVYYPPQPPIYHRAQRQSYRDANHPAAVTGEDPFVGNMFHPVENGGLDSIHLEADQEFPFPFHGPETYGPDHVPPSSFFAMPVERVGRTMVNASQRSDVVPAPEQPVHDPYGVAIAVNRRQQEYYHHQEAVEAQQQDGDIMGIRDGKHWNSSEDEILIRAVAVQGPPTDWGQVSTAFFAGSRSASSVRLQIMDHARSYAHD
jgi:hypothetical protein